MKATCYLLIRKKSTVKIFLLHKAKKRTDGYPSSKATDEEPLKS